LTASVRLPFLPVPFLVALAFAPAAAAEPVRTLSVAPERALSATLTLPAKKSKVRLETGPWKLTVKSEKDGDDLLVRGVDVDLGRNRERRTQRLIVANHDGITTVTLGAGVLARTSSRTVRLRGAVRLADFFASSVADPVDRLAQRAGMLHFARPRTQAYLGQGIDGALHYRELRNWAAGFLPGLLWQVAAERNSVIHARWAMDEVRDLRKVATLDDPDVGFVFWRAAQLGHDLACTTTVPRLALSAQACAQLGSLSRQAADRLVARSATNPLGLIPTWADETLCSQCLPGELRIIVDQLHNLPVLTESPDPARRALALTQARWIAANLLRPDGAGLQQGFIARATGALTRTGNYQGFDDVSVWSRGQAWMVSGLARAATDLEDPVLLAAAVRAAEWWLARFPVDVPPPYDFTAPPGAPRDSSALAILGAGLAVLADRCRATGECDGARYEAAADAAATALVARLESGAQLGRLGEGAYTVGKLPWDESAELPWGTDFLAELLTR
jgi:unsaturated chondroitin disaccharide hydrolase